MMPSVTFITTKPSLCPYMSGIRTLCPNQHLNLLEGAQEDLSGTSQESIHIRFPGCPNTIANVHIRPSMADVLKSTNCCSCSNNQRQNIILEWLLLAGCLVCHEQRLLTCTAAAALWALLRGSSAMLALFTRGRMSALNLQIGPAMAAWSS